jgi:hypothetical protein
VVAHHVWVLRALRADRVVRVLPAAPDARVLSARDEPVHPAVGDVGDRVRLAVRPAGVQVARVVERLLAAAGRGVRDADGEAAVGVPWKAVGAGIRTEVVIERPVLLHDDDHVLDLVDADRRLPARRM